MKVLTLYVDKWYITGAVCSDGVPRIVKPRSRDDRFWLYFYEDTVNDKVIYGKNNKPHFHNRENHYYGDVFSLIVYDENTFTIYNMKKTMADIFKFSGIIGELRDAVGAGDNQTVDVYLSFSKDVSYAARRVFINKVLEQENFTVKESAAHIEHLALEYAVRHKRLGDEGCYITLNACNENLVHSIYEYKEGLFNRRSEKSLDGFGTDLRGRAILESVVHSINRSEHFLQSMEDFEREYIRLAQYVDDWVVRLNNAKPGRPVKIPDVSLSANIEKKYSPVILKKDIDARTSVSVDNIIREIANSVKENDISGEDIKGIVFIGDTFTNTQFTEALKRRYILPESGYVFYNTEDLPNIVSVYTVMDCTQFSVAAKDMSAKGDAELKSTQMAKEEARRKEEAERQAKEREEKVLAERERKMRYENAMNEADDAYKKEDYVAMRDWADEALKNNPGDADATEKKEEALRLIAEQEMRQKQYADAIKKAQASLKEGRWQDALSQSEQALACMKDSAEAKRIQTEAKKQITLTGKIDTGLSRADLLMSQRQYAKALEELKAVAVLDKDNALVKEKTAEVQRLLDESLATVKTLRAAYDKTKAAGNMEEAINACRMLADADAGNQQQWLAEVESLKAEKEKAEAAERLWKELSDKAWDANFNEQWADTVKYATAALKIKEDGKLKTCLDKAKEKLRKQEAEQAYTGEINKVKGFIVDKRFDEAKHLLSSLEKQYPERKAELKELFRQIFKAESSESFFDTQETPEDDAVKKPVVVKGFTKDGAQKTKKPLDDDFFGNTQKVEKKTGNSTRKKPVGKPTETAKVTAAPDFFSEPLKSGNKGSGTVQKKPASTVKKAGRTGDDFFDSDTWSGKPGGKSGGFDF